MAKRSPVTAVRSYKKQKQKEEKAIPILFPMPVEKLRSYMGTHDRFRENREENIWTEYENYEGFSRAYDEAFRQHVLGNEELNIVNKTTNKPPLVVGRKNKTIKSKKKKPLPLMKGHVHKKSVYFENLTTHKSRKENIKPLNTQRKKNNPNIKSEITNRCAKGTVNKSNNGVDKNTQKKNTRASTGKNEKQIRHSRNHYESMKKNIISDTPVLEAKMDSSYENLPPKYIEKLHEMRIRYEVSGRSPRRTVLVENDKSIPVGTNTVVARTKAKEKAKYMTLSTAQMERMKEMKLKYNEIKYQDPELAEMKKRPPAVEGKRQHVDSWIVRHKSLTSLTLHSLPSTSL